MIKRKFNNWLRDNIWVQMSMIQTHTVAECADLAMWFERRVDEIHERNQQLKDGEPQRRGHRKNFYFSPMTSSDTTGGSVQVN